MSRGPLDPTALGAVLERHLGHGTRVAGLERLSGGASRETWAFDAEMADGARLPMVLRREPRGGASMPGPQVPEYELIERAGAAGVPVAPLRFALTDDDGLGVGFVADRVEGETLGRRIVHGDAHATARTTLARQCGVALARIHSIDVGDLPLPSPPQGATPTSAHLDQLTGLVDGFDAARPVVELGLRWLRDHEPPEGRRCLVHGDFRVGNLIVGPEGLVAVLDWELAHVGDPFEDLGWLCVRSWRFGGTGRVGGVGAIDDLVDGYRSAGGADVGDDDVHYWEVFGNVRWAVICMVQAFTHLHGVRRSVELAAIGRRVCEVEHDLMELLG